MSIQVSRTAFAGFSNCVEVKSAHFVLTAAVEIGPRILFFGAPGGQNLLWVNPEHEGKRGGADWRIYGGHRLWHAPESNPRSYAPDNDPVQVEITATTITLSQSVESGTGIEKEIALIPDTEGRSVRIRHKLTNRSHWRVELAPWAITAMASGSTALVPVPHGEPGLLPAGSIAVWPYSNLADERFTAGTSFLRVKQNRNPQAFKIGSHAKRGWCAGASAHGTLVKRVAYNASASYPDFGSTVEVYTNEHMLELETLGPLTVLEPGGSATHDEVWSFAPENFALLSDEELVKLASLP